MLYAAGVSRLRRPFLSDRFFFVTVRLLKERSELSDADFDCLALAFNRARHMHPYLLTAWVFLPDHWHAICAPRYPLTISVAIKSVKMSSLILINRWRGEHGELWQGRFFDRALRTVREYNEKVEYIHLNPVKAGLVRRAQDWRWSSKRRGPQNRRSALCVSVVLLRRAAQVGEACLLEEFGGGAGVDGEAHSG